MVQQYGPTIPILGSSNPNSEHISREDYKLKRYTHSSVHCSSIYSSWDTETVWVSTDRWMDKDAIHIYNDYYSAIKSNKRIPFAATRMDLESIILNEMLNKDKYHDSFLCGIKKMVQMNLFTKKKRTQRLWKQTYNYQRGKLVVGRDKSGGWD